MINIILVVLVAIWVFILTLLWIKAIKEDKKRNCMYQNDLLEDRRQAEQWFNFADEPMAVDTSITMIKLADERLKEMRKNEHISRD